MLSCKFLSGAFGNILFQNLPSGMYYKARSCEVNSPLGPGVFTLYTLQFALHTLHFTICTPHSTLHTFHPILYTPQSTIRKLPLTLYTFPLTLYTRHSNSTLQFLRVHFALHPLPPSTVSPARCRVTRETWTRLFERLVSGIGARGLHLVSLAWQLQYFAHVADMYLRGCCRMLFPWRAQCLVSRRYCFVRLEAFVKMAILRPFLRGRRKASDASGPSFLVHGKSADGGKIRKSYWNCQASIFGVPFWRGARFDIAHACRVALVSRPGAFVSPSMCRIGCSCCVPVLV